MERMTGLQALKQFLTKDGGRPLTMDEIKALSSDERRELCEMASKELGVELVPVGV